MRRQDKKYKKLYRVYFKVDDSPWEFEAAFIYPSDARDWMHEQLNGLYHTELTCAYKIKYNRKTVATRTINN
jgi:hypothetical protein